MAKPAARKSAARTAPATDAYQDVTDAIVAALEAGTKPWEKPWQSGGVAQYPLRSCGTPYRGINVLVLWMTAQTKGYSSPYWMTFKQAIAIKGACVRKGEKGSKVFYSGSTAITEENSSGDEETRIARFLKSYTVFNVEQIDGLPAHYYPQPVAPTERQKAERIEHAEAFFAAIPSTVNHGGNRAFYRLDTDQIQMPQIEDFTDAERYYSTLAHEHGHWTRHKTRLDRDFGRKRWGDAGYAAEELVAELSAAFTCATLGFRPDHIEDHAAYIGSWLEVLKNDKRAIFTAASHAQRAADYLAAYSGATIAAEDEDEQRAA